MYIKVNDTNLYYEDRGFGVPILLLHGWEASSKTFTRLSMDLKDKYRVITVDLPGFGNSTIDCFYSIYEIADIIIEFINKLKLKEFYLLGHSYGGRIAIIVASKVNVKKLILVSSAGIKKRLSFNKRMSVSLYKILRKTGISLKMGSIDYKRANHLKRRMLVDAVNHDLKKEMAKITTPTLLIYGDKDETTPLKSVGSVINKSIKSSSLAVIKGADHFPYIGCYHCFFLILSIFLEG